MKNFVKYIPYAVAVLGIIGGSVGSPSYAGEICCGIITIITVFYIVDGAFSKKGE